MALSKKIKNIAQYNNITFCHKKKEIQDVTLIC